jgi:hypothetical protein
MRFMAILDQAFLRPLEAPAGNFEQLLASLWRDLSAPARPAAADAYCAAAQDPLLLAEWLRATDAAEQAP